MKFQIISAECEKYHELKTNYRTVMLKILTLLCTFDRKMNIFTNVGDYVVSMGFFNPYESDCDLFYVIFLNRIIAWNDL